MAFFDGTNGAALEPNTSGSAHSKQFVRRGPVQALVGLIAVTSAPIPAGEPVVASTPPDESVAPRLTQCRMTSCQAGTEMGVYVLCSSNFSSITQMSFDNNALKGQQQRPCSVTSNSLIQHFKGQLPEEIAQLTQLKEIDIRHNLLTGCGCTTAHQLLI
jgi:hypothetical protein